MDSKNLRDQALKGIVQAIPIVLGYLPVGTAFGVLAQKAGLSTLNALLMSLLVFAGAAQFIAVGLFSSGIAPYTIVLTTLIVNLRHLVMASSMAPYLKHWRKPALAAFAYELTDETFAMHSAQFVSGVPGQVQVLATNITSQAAWVAGTWLGAVAGQFIGEIEPYGLDYALPALFIALLVLQIQNYVQVIVAALTGLLSVALMQLGVNQWNVLLATLLGATIGLVLEQWTKRSSS
ncbi:MAG: AzlC family ABC transporter permease [Anaerolineae bacterium]|nr:AzlC family ABC transporter permease [Anaerolineae bacterium]